MNAILNLGSFDFTALLPFVMLGFIVLSNILAYFMGKSMGRMETYTEVLKEINDAIEKKKLEEKENDPDNRFQSK